MKSKRLALAGLFSLMMVSTALAGETTGLPTSLAATETPKPAAATKAKWPEPPKAPADAPNIVVILLDDVGFAASSTYGGPVQTPVLQALAGDGLRYNNFNVTALCSPTRAALLSGRNPHRVGFGTVAELARPQPGYNSVWPKSAASVAEVLRENGYSTAAFGKWHNTPDWEVNPAGPFDHWPTHLGFQHFYGFMAGEASQWEPVIYRDTTAVQRPAGKNYYFPTDMTDKSIDWLRAHESAAPDKPFFLYYAASATHVPLHVPKAWSAKYHDKFEGGWDALRKKIFERQKALGVIPADTVATDRPDMVPAWDSLSPEKKKVLERQMEVYAGYLAETDHEVGRLLDAIHKMGDTKNTLVFYIVGDNGADALAGVDGSDYAVAQNLYRISPPVKDRLAHLNDLGGPDFDDAYSSGWAWALSTPFKGVKGDGAHFGGTRVGMVVSWPSHIKDAGGLRTQFTNVTDIASTIYDVVGITPPATVDGVKQMDQDGRSFAFSFDNPNEPSHDHIQYYETVGNRSIYDDGWVAAAKHWLPWDHHFPSMNFDADKWELYDANKDFSESDDLAAKYPERLKKLQALFDREAKQNDVLPLGNAFSGKMLGEAGPSLTAGRTEFTYFPSHQSLPLSVAPDLTHSHSIVADLEIPAHGKVQGTILSIGSRFGGVALYVQNGRLMYENNYFGWKRDLLKTAHPLPKGKVKVEFDLTRDSQKIGGGGWGELFVDGKSVGKQHFDQIGWAAAIFGAFDIGATRVSPVAKGYGVPFKFTGKIDDITIKLKK